MWRVNWTCYYCVLKKMEKEQLEKKKLKGAKEKAEKEKAEKKKLKEAKIVINYDDMASNFTYFKRAKFGSVAVYDFGFLSQSLTADLFYPQTLRTKEIFTGGLQSFAAAQLVFM
ncbi:hypothetical protein Tco_1387099 [Tanacetum coccineum]